MFKRLMKMFGTSGQSPSEPANTKNFESFRAEFVSRFSEVGLTVDPLLLGFLDHLGIEHYDANAEAFVAIEDRGSVTGLTSEVYFCERTDLVRFWVGEDGYERHIIPILHCSGTGSYIAVWSHDDVQRYVFLGDEGTPFVIANTPEALICLLAMGYEDIFGTDVLSLPTQDSSHEGTDANRGSYSKTQSFYRSIAKAPLPKSYAPLLPYALEDDPFAALVEKIVEG